MYVVDRKQDVADEQPNATAIPKADVPAKTPDGLTSDNPTTTTNHQSAILRSRIRQSTSHTMAKKGTVKSPN